MARNYFQYVLGAQWGENEGEEITREFGDDQGNAMMRLVAQMICFSDCSDERVTKIVYEGREIEYYGWQPGMLLEFCDMVSGKIVWSCCRPDWDH
jgi:hypothetical protein